MSTPTWTPAWSTQALVERLARFAGAIYLTGQAIAGGQAVSTGELTAITTELWERTK